jgi:hypothetical protein
MRSPPIASSRDRRRGTDRGTTVYRLTWILRRDGCSGELVSHKLKGKKAWKNGRIMDHSAGGRRIFQ